MGLQCLVTNEQTISRVLLQVVSRWMWPAGHQLVRADLNPPCIFNEVSTSVLVIVCGR
jgi:hypothetical protein